MRAVYAVFTALIKLCQLMQTLLIVRALMSWLPLGPGPMRIYELLCQFTDPLLYPFRRLTQRLQMRFYLPIDLSYLAAFFALSLVMRLISMLYTLLY